MRGGCKYFFRLFTKAFKALCKLNKIQIFELLIARVKVEFQISIFLWVLLLQKLSCNLLENT